jgi:hypothetical protein
MEQELHKIHLIPARFLEKHPEGYVIRCLTGNDAQDVIFDEYSLQGMVNPNLLMIGIMTGVGYSQINFMKADEFEKLFKKHWKEVL